MTVLATAVIGGNVYRWTPEGWSSEQDPDLVPLLNARTAGGIPNAQLPDSMSNYLASLKQQFGFDSITTGLVSSPDDPGKVY